MVCATRPVMSLSFVPTSWAYRLCSVRRHRHWSRGQMRKAGAMACCRSISAPIPKQRSPLYILDTRKMALKEGVSEPLIAAIQERLARGEQSLVFEPPWIRPRTGLPGLWLDLALHALCCKHGAAPCRSPFALPSLRLRTPYSEGLSDLRQSGYSSVRAWHAAPGGLVAGAISGCTHPPCRS